MPLTQHTISRLIHAAERAQGIAQELVATILAEHQAATLGTRDPKRCLDILAAYANAPASRIDPNDAALVAQEREHLRLTWRRNEKRRKARTDASVAGALDGFDQAVAEAVKAAAPHAPMMPVVEPDGYVPLDEAKIAAALAALGSDDNAEGSDADAVAPAGESSQ